MASPLAVSGRAGTMITQSMFAAGAAAADGDAGAVEDGHGVGAADVVWAGAVVGAGADVVGSGAGAVLGVLGSGAAGVVAAGAAAGLLTAPAGVGVLGADNALYTRVKNSKLRARFLRNAYYHLADRLECDETGRFFLNLSGVRHPIASAPPT